MNQIGGAVLLGMHRARSARDTGHSVLSPAGSAGSLFICADGCQHTCWQLPAPALGYARVLHPDVPHGEQDLKGDEADDPVLGPHRPPVLPQLERELGHVGGGGQQRGQRLVARRDLVLGPAGGGGGRVGVWVGGGWWWLWWFGGVRVGQCGRQLARCALQAPAGRA